MPEKKAKSKEHHVKTEDGKKYFFSICFLACVLTATFVVICFAAGIMAAMNYQNKNDYVERANGAFGKEVDRAVKGEITKLSAAGLIDFFSSEETGFIYAATGDCAKCQSFKANLVEAAKKIEVIDQTYQYTYPHDPGELDKYAHEISISTEEAPVLLYVRGGRIYDRLDETNSDLAISTFLAKYK